MSNPIRADKTFVLGHRIAFFSSLVLLILSFSALSFQFELGQAASYALLAAIIVYIVVYVVISTLIKARFIRLNRDVYNIGHKKFEEIVNGYEYRRDELDIIIKQTIRTAETVEREIQRLKRIENYRKEFIGDVSHELKTPIFAVQGFVETLLSGALEDETVNREFLRKAMRNVNRLIILTNDLMEISKLETGELKTNFMEFSLKGLVQEVVENLQYKANREQVSLQIGDMSDKLNAMADRNQLRQVLTNLVENGIKYNKPQGTVTIGVKAYQKNPIKHLVFIKDSGIGIDENDIPRVTERFFRVDKSRSREKGGTGLGLAIVKHIIEAHGEQLFIESKPGIGTTFSFTLANADRV